MTRTDTSPETALEPKCCARPDLASQSPRPARHPTQILVHRQSLHKAGKSLEGLIIPRWCRDLISQSLARAVDLIIIMRCGKRKDFFLISLEPRGLPWQPDR